MMNGFAKVYANCILKFRIVFNYSIIDALTNQAFFIGGMRY